MNDLRMQKQMKYILTILILLLFMACEKVFDPAVDNVAPILVVEGSISTVPGVHKVKLTYTNGYNNNSTYTGIRGASVFVTDDKSKTIQYFETGEGGLYLTDTNKIIKAEIGRSYRLHIKTKEGDEYESSPQTIVKCAPIDSLSCEYDEQKVMELDGYGTAYQVTYDGMRVIENTKGLYPNHNFYLYSWEAYEEYCMTVVQGINTNLMYKYQKLDKYSDVICTGNADDYTNQEIIHNRLLFLVNKELQNPVPQIPDSLIGREIDSVIATTFHGMIFRLEQKSLSDNAFLFWNGVQKQLDASGKLFDPVASQIVGNINCTSDPLKKACGVFYAYDVAEKYAYLYINSKGRTASSQLTGFPEIILDSLFLYLPPDGWVRPPFN
jgi:hypothetical protein